MEKKTKETRVSYTLPITNNNVITSASFELPKFTSYVKGIQLTSDYPTRLFYRGQQRIEIGGEELFPEDFQSKLLMSSLSVAPKERFFELGEVLPRDLSVKVRFTDRDHPSAVFEEGYTLTLVLLIEE